MKKSILFFVLLLSVSLLQAQMPEKFVKAMEAKVSLIDSTTTSEGYIELANSFERIANAEKNQWLPFYYAAFCQVMSGYFSMGDNPMGGDASKIDPIADKAKELLDKAEALEPNNSEIFLVRKMVHSLHMMGNPMQRYMSDGQAATEALEKAKKLNPDNPRIYLQEAQDKYYTPEQFGGSKDEAKRLFEKAYKQYEIFKPASSIHPNWGLSQVNYFLSQFK